MFPVVIVGALALAACGGGSDDADEAFDSERACRIGQRLVDETAQADRDGVVAQIERLDDLQGVEDSPLDVDQLDEFAEGLDEDAVDDLVLEFETLDCELETPDTSAPPDTAAPTTDAPIDTTPADTTASTEAPADPAATTDAPPDTTETTETEPETSAVTPPAEGGGTRVDIGSSGPGPAFGIDLPTEQVLADFAIVDMLYSPDTNVVEVLIGRDSSFTDELTYASSDTITMSATTDQTLEDVRTAYRTAIEALGFDYDFTEATSSSDGTNVVGLAAEPSGFDPSIPSWEINVAQEETVPGVVLVDVDRRVDLDGALPPIPAPATDLLQATADIGTDLGWTVTGFRYSESADTVSSGTFVSGTVDWNVSEDNTVREAATALQDAVGVPIRDEEVGVDRISWFLDDGSSTLFSVNYFEFGGTTASFNP